MRVKELPDFSLAEKLWYERKTTGAYFAGHPTDLVRAKFAHKVTRKVSELSGLLDFGTTEPIILLALIVGIYPKTAVTVVAIEDETARGEIIFSRERAQKYGFILWRDGKPALDRIALFKCSVRRGERFTSIDCEQAYPAGDFTAPSNLLPSAGSKRG